ncbi:MAG TPA: hypothetical protein PKA06_05130 [Gemmatales bacterium]|nr:hypothetical protein [Gemmatales bacterium]HMP16779.1 hypothetical protein [Gemmatales bacterium]
MLKSLDQKLANIHANPSSARDFILADAKDADMAFGIGAPGLSPERHDGELKYKTLAEYRAQIREILEQGLVDIMLMSASTSEVLALQERLFDHSLVTPAARANDTTDVHVLRGGKYITQPALPFSTATLDHIQCGRLDCAPAERLRGVNLGLYSLTFNNNAADDRARLEEYKRFRLEAEAKGFRHFLEVFDPHPSGSVPAEQVASFVNDAIARTLAGVTGRGRPIFLKIVYHGPKAMEELVRYDPHLVVGILGGSAGTTYDAFKMLAEAKKYGARAALYGRKINSAECQLAFVRLLRHIADGDITPEDAVKAYHGVLQRLKITPKRSLEEDMQLHTNVMSYAGSGTVISLPKCTGKSSIPATRAAIKKDKKDCKCGGDCCSGKNAYPTLANGEPDFAQMTTAQKIAYHTAERKRIWG